MPQDDRIFPSLLDRLTDLDPRGSVEAESGVTLDGFRAMVSRDLIRLLNASSLPPSSGVRRDFAKSIDETDSKWPRVAWSVLNYGVDPVIGGFEEAQRGEWLSKQLEEIILRYEPRLREVRVRCFDQPSVGNGKPDGGSAEFARIGTLRFEITGQLQVEPVPQYFLLEPVVDAQTGRWGT